MKENTPKTAILVLLHLSKVEDKYYVAIDGNTIELKEFGIDMTQFNKMGDQIEKVIQSILGKDK